MISAVSAIKIRDFRADWSESDGSRDMILCQNSFGQ